MSSLIIKKAKALMSLESSYHYLVVIYPQFFASTIMWLSWVKNLTVAVRAMTAIKIQKNQMTKELTKPCIPTSIPFINFKL
jgi:hypothetical protein